MLLSTAAKDALSIYIFPVLVCVFMWMVKRSASWIARQDWHTPWFQILPDAENLWISSSSFFTCGFLVGTTRLKIEQRWPRHVLVVIPKGSKSRLAHKGNSSESAQKFKVCGCVCSRAAFCVQIGRHLRHAIIVGEGALCYHSYSSLTECCKYLSIRISRSSFSRLMGYKLLLSLYEVLYNISMKTDFTNFV